MACSVIVVFPELSGPKISMIRPRGKPPIPRALSSDIDPVDGQSVEVISPSAQQAAGHANNSSDDFLFYFAYEVYLDAESPPDISCVYIGNLNVTDCEMVVTIEDGTVLASTQQVDNFLFLH